MDSNEGVVRFNITKNSSSVTTDEAISAEMVRLGYADWVPWQVIESGLDIFAEVIPVQRRRSFNITDTLIGKKEDEAKKLCGWENYCMVVSCRDGVNYFFTLELRTDRIKVVLENGIVISACIG